MNVRIVGDRFLVDGTPGLIFGGEFQYFRIPPNLWEKGVSTLKAAGVNLLSSYVPWIWHEPEEGVFDFRGKHEPAADLVGFIELCRSLGMPLILKPGPYIYAEYQGFGIPLWVRERYPELRMQVPGVEDYPEIALNHPAFLALVERWFGALWPHLRDCEGLLAIQLDNETGLPQYGSGPFLYDANADTLFRFQAFLSNKYLSIRRLNAKWQSDYRDWGEILYPKGAVPAPMLADSFAFAEDYLAQYLASLKKMWEDLGFRGLLFSNELAMPAWPNHLRKKSEVMSLAYDLYPKFIRVRTDLDQPFSISFVPKVFAAIKRSGPLFSAEMGCGWLDEGVSVTNVATLQKTLASYLHGAQGLILYPIQDGIEPDCQPYSFRSAIDRRGKPSERMDAVEAIGRFCASWGADLSRSEPLESPVGILIHCEGMHDLLPYAADPLDTLVHRLDEALDRSVVLYSANAGLFGALSEAGYDARVIDLSAELSELASCKVLFYNSSGSLSPEGRAKLKRYVEGGGILVSMGIPLEDDFLFPGRAKRCWRPQGASAALSYFGEWLSFRLFERPKILHPLVRFTVDKLQPVIGLLKHASRAGVWLKSPLTGERVWASRFVTYFDLPPEARSLLSFSDVSTAYCLPRGDGFVACFGTLLGPHLNSPGYYLDDPAKRVSLGKFFAALLGRWKVSPLVSPLPGVEVVLRRLDGAGILGLINRGKAMDFSLVAPVGFPQGRISRVFSFLGSEATSENGRLSGRIEGGDVLILKIEADHRSASPA